MDSRCVGRLIEVLGEGILAIVGLKGSAQVSNPPPGARRFQMPHLKFTPKTTSGEGSKRGVVHFEGRGQSTRSAGGWNGRGSLAPGERMDV